MKSLGLTANYVHEESATTVSGNVNGICKAHNNTNRELDVSVHLNAGGGTGVEVLYVTSEGQQLAAKLSAELAKVMGIKDRGAKKRTDLGFLNNTKETAILIELAFIDSESDMKALLNNKNKVASAIVEVITGKTSNSTNASENVSIKKDPITHIGVVTIKGGTVNIYKEAEAASYNYVKKLNEGSYKVYAVSANGMLNVGTGWIAKPNGTSVTYKQFVLKNNCPINVYNKPEAVGMNYVKKLPVGNWKIYSIDSKTKMVCIGLSNWVIQDTEYVELV